MTVLPRYMLEKITVNLEGWAVIFFYGLSKTE